MRKYLVLQYNVVDAHGVQHPDRLIEDGLAWYGSAWWLDARKHITGDCYEFITGQGCLIGPNEIPGTMDILALSYGDGA